MICNLILSILKGVLNLLLLPLTGIDIAIDFLASIPVFVSFLQVVAYIFPWGNLLPLFLLTMLIISFKITVALIKTIKQVIPFV